VPVEAQMRNASTGQALHVQALLNTTVEAEA
jgi:hypothetical protein